MASFAQQVIWTALPRPMDGKKLQVSVLASPRLTVSEPAVSLKTFPDWMDWPSVVAKARFTVTFGSQRFQAEAVSRPDSKIWQAIFDDKTIVRGREDADLSGKMPMSYRAAAMALRLRKTYVDVASRWPNRPPTAADLRTPLDDFIKAPSGPDLLKALSGPSAAGRLKELGRLADLAEFHAFQAPFLTSFNTPPGPKEGRQLIDGMDFHRLVATLGQHALLLRQTGLVIDLSLDGEPRPDEALLAVDVK